MSALLQIEGDIPLVVNLDGPLLKFDSSLEALIHLLVSDAWTAVKLPCWIAGGRDRLRHELTTRTKINAELLPYDDTILEYLRNKRANGRRLVLVSAASQCVVDRISEHLGLFEEAHGSTRDLKLTEQAKADLLVKRFGEGRFDYVGDAAHDWAVWSNARRVITMNAPTQFRKRVDWAFPGAEHLGGQPVSFGRRLTDHLAALRPDQWTKNLLIFVPVVADHKFDPQVSIATMIAFAAFCLAASSVYVLNDLVDLSNDRQHPWKHTRPFASGRVPVLHGIVMNFLLLAAALLLSASYLSGAFVTTLMIYYVLTLLYSLKLKRMLVLDMLTLASLYTIRVIAGGAATGIEISEWLLALSMFIFLSLAAVKRQSELMDLAKRERRRAPGRRYVVSDLPMIRNFGTSAGYISVLVLALYISNIDNDALYSRPILLWGTCPLLLYWISRMLLKAHRGEIRRDPIVFAFRDRASWCIAILIGAFVVAASVPWP